MKGGIAAEIRGERGRESCERERREESRWRRWVLRERLEVKENEVREKMSSLLQNVDSTTELP
ncbi:hypothetical protein TIFTF001_027143 [Ficus carica]|uniref:Uncharacterized protein n=1 Tax=Ficus carica TaxID=3494 RepID=A0AA88IUM7_FICCA|nr:hypothetical protein TIFTF001_027143 [Ficus carica]